MIKQILTCILLPAVLGTSRTRLERVVEFEVRTLQILSLLRDLSEDKHLNVDSNWKTHSQWLWIDTMSSLNPLESADIDDFRAYILNNSSYRSIESCLRILFNLSRHSRLGFVLLPETKPTPDKFESWRTARSQYNTVKEGCCNFLSLHSSALPPVRFTEFELASLESIISKATDIQFKNHQPEVDVAMLKLACDSAVEGLALNDREIDAYINEEELKSSSDLLYSARLPGAREILNDQIERRRTSLLVKECKLADKRVEALNNFKTAIFSDIARAGGQDDPSDERDIELTATDVDDTGDISTASWKQVFPEVEAQIHDVIMKMAQCREELRILANAQEELKKLN